MPTFTHPIPYPEDLPRPPASLPPACEVKAWVADRYRAHGFFAAGGAWGAFDRGLHITREDSVALHATLVDIACRIRDMSITDQLSNEEHAARWALNREIEAILLLLEDCRTSLDGQVFAQVFDWPGGDSTASRVAFYLFHAPMKTMRSLEPWLRAAVERDDLDVHSRALLLRPLGRLDDCAAVRLARELFDCSPWITSDVLGMFGGPPERDFLLGRLPQFQKRGLAEERRRINSAIRKLERKARREGRSACV